MFQQALTKFSRRPFPRNLHALRSCRVSYAQFGEDLFLTSLLGYEKDRGVYVDVGCYHPINYSNTYIFYQRGWRGVAIDPNPRWIPAWKRYRPRDRFVNTAVTSKVSSMSYVMNAQYPACNRLVGTTSHVANAGETVTVVTTRPLKLILEELLPAEPIDLLNVDCEGHDLEVIQTYDFANRRPHVIAAEDTTVQIDSPLCVFLDAMGYACKGFIGLTKIFQDKV